MIKTIPKPAPGVVLRTFVLTHDSEQIFDGPFKRQGELNKAIAAYRKYFKHEPVVRDMPTEPIAPGWYDELINDRMPNF